jgi:hypothetical protein
MGCTTANSVSPDPSPNCDHAVQQPGTYTVTILAAETYFQAAGERVFNVIIQASAAATLVECSVWTSSRCHQPTYVVETLHVTYAPDSCSDPGHLRAISR